MSRDVWKQAVERAPVPERAQLALNQLRTADAADFLSHADDEQVRILSALWSGSEWASDMLRQHPGWIETLTPQHLGHARQPPGLRREVEKWFAPLLAAGSYSEAFAELRRFKQREMIRIAARDLARLASTEELILEVSNVADVCLNAVLQLSLRQHTMRFGKPFEQDSAGRWRGTTFCVLGLGKLGGQELNYSSDVDVLFVYSDEGSVFKEPPRKGKTARASLTNHQFFKRVAEQFVAEVGKMTGDGMLYRIDLRLRPEGDAGPLVRSLASYENYYAQWGQTWERMMLIKARCAAGDTTLAGEFLEMTQSFRYPRSLSKNVLNEIAATKERIESEVVKSGELDRNVKLGRGGIREIEFVVQALQLLHAGRNPFLQSPQTLPTLHKLVQYHLLERAEADALAAAYSFLRDVEHRLQMEHNQQTHTLPVSSVARTRIAKLMGFAAFKLFDRERAKHSQQVRAVYERLLQAPAEKDESPLPASFDEGAQWQMVLQQHSFREPQQAAKLLREFALGPGYGHVSARTTELATQLIPKLLALCPRSERRTPVRRVATQQKRTESEFGAPIKALSDPDRVVARLDTFVSAYGARATLYEMWSSNPALFELMLMLFDRSEFLAEVAIRTPDLVDELMLSGHLQKRKSADAVFHELCHGAEEKDQRMWLRRYHQSELMRIGLRDILGLADYEQNFEELSALAEACLRYAFHILMRKQKRHAAPFAIIGWGKLGGAELNYGSDLDITFVAPNHVRQLSKLQKFAAELLELLSSPSELGVAFVTDTRLRPDGEKGLLVNTIGANREYYERRAALWEIQSLTRTRFIAGDASVGKEFQAMAGALTDFSKGPQIPAFTPDWKFQIAAMRGRIEKERTPAGQDALAIKTGSGGLIDAEFVAQVFCLEHGWHEPTTLAALQRAQQDEALPENDAKLLIENYRRLRRLEAILRRWSFAGETVLPAEPAPLYRVAVRCGFANADEFMSAVAQWRRALREVYQKVLAVRVEDPGE